MTKKLFFIILVAIFINTILAGVAVAQPRDLEIDYPSFNLLQAPTTVKTLLPNYVKYIIVFGIAASGLIIFGSLLYAGFLYMTSSGNPATLKDSRSRMLSSFLGIIILLSSYLILNTINPNLIELKIERANTGGAVFIDSGAKQYETMTNVPDFSETGISAPVRVEFLGEGLEVVPCLNKNNFDRSNCEVIYPTITVNGSFPSNAKAAKLIWKIPGVYLYDQTNYRGEIRVYNTSSGSLDQFNNKAESVSILNFVDSLNLELDRRFGAILHDGEGYKDSCKFIWENTNTLSDWNNKAGALTVFKYKGTMPPEGDGVQFYNEPDYLDPWSVPVTKQKTWGIFPVGAEDGIDSVKIDGNYLVAIAENKNGTGRCEVFTNSDSNLSDNPIGKCTVIAYCAPGCWGFLGFCPVCTSSCASSYIVIPLGW